MKNRQFGLVFVVFGVTFISLTSAATRTSDEIKFKCAKCECCRGGCNQATGICDDQTACLDGYWGQQGIKDAGDDGDCRHECYDTNPPCTSCGMNGGLWCSTCIDGYYVPPAETRYTAPKCTLECNTDCQACVESASACTSCKPGFYGPTSGCTECVAGKHGTLCDKDCPVNCVSCASASQCTACSSGYYGDTCLTPCSPGCDSSGCDKGSGDCSSCIMNFEGKTCDTCVIGKYGNSCDQECSNGCDSSGCQKDSGFCLSCDPGFFGTTCQSTCPSGCDSSGCRKDSGDCLSCDTGYYGTTCQSTCPSGCDSSGCRKDSGDCLSCDTAYYGTTCQSTCPSGCDSSSCQKDSGFCLSCDPGFYGTTCQTPCPSGCDSDGCDQIFGNCNSCKTNFKGEKCDSCIVGKYGPNCEQACPIGCDSNGCLKDSGDCYICIANFTGEQCNICVNGTFGDKCNKDCPMYCTHGKCHRTNGTCTDGCQYDHMEGDTCDRCEAGRYGTTCTLQCSTGCIQLTCDKNNATCDQGCLDNFQGYQCNECIPGKHGGNCSEDCPENCLNGSCNGDNGKCNGCSGNYTGDTCEQCKAGFYGGDCIMQCSTGCSSGTCIKDNGTCSPCAAGYYGTNCELKCSVGCNNDECVQETGVCEPGCKANYSGDMCCVNDMNSHCKACDSTQSCSVCVEGYYSQICNQSCSDHCVNNTCDMSSGRCMNCDRARHGDKCELNCPSGCLDDSPSARVCSRDSGHCLIGCMNNTYGYKCEHNCSEKCQSGSKTEVCDRYTGTCSNGCVSGFFGPKCGEECSSNCAESRCNGTNGFCECRAGYTGDTCAEAIPQTATEDPGPSSVGAIGGGVGGAVVVIVVVVILVVFVFRRRRQNAKPSTKYEESPAAKTEAHDVAVSGPLYGNINTVRGSSGVKNAAVNKNTDKEEDADPDFIGVDVTTENVYVNQVPAGIKVAQLYSYVKSKTANAFKNDFMKFPNKLSAPYIVSQMSQNIGKNRYKGMYPYDHSRVTIDQDPDFYMNASFINGFQKNKQYIASLGPMVANSDHFVTFWKMIWYLDVEVIVMLTNLIEGGVQKCEQYWPDTLSTQRYGDVTITCEQETELAEYVKKTLKLTKDGQEKYVYYFHFSVWPDKSVPDDVCSLVEFRERVNQVAKGRGSNQAPILVHCSAGVGRTGTFIALDVLTECGKHTGTVNVPKCVDTLRKQRVNMVQTAAQYEYLHKCLVYKLTTDCTLMTTQDITDVINKSDSKQFAKPHKMLQVVDLNVDTEDEEARQKNAALADKNRPAGDVPGNRWRPRLFLNRALADSDYINAVQINTSTRRDGFIIAQTPLPATVTDFLTLVYQSQAAYIVSLDDSKNRKQDEGVYQPPDNQVMKCGVFTISSEKCVSNPQYTERKLTLKSSVKSMGERVVHHFQFSQWPRDNAVPTDTTGFVQLVKIINRKLETAEEPVIVHCLTGSDRAAVFCAVSVLLDKLKLENKVSVLNTLRQIKLRRRTAFSKKEHVEFCYSCLAAGDDGKDVYYNFN